MVDIYINFEVLIGFIEGGFGIVVKFVVLVGDFDKDIVFVFVNKVYEVCLYLNVICGNIVVELLVI